jgi:CDP-glucose 4,6-dehydratase
VVVNRGFWSGKRVFVTGHTGFKGGWLSLWLAHLGSEVHGYALEPPTDPSFFESCGLGRRMASSTIADLRDAARLREAMRRCQPQVVMHLAAQPLVRRSYADPVETFSVNALGTVHLLDAVRSTDSVRAVVNVTTDKCYEPATAPRPHREDDPMGGRDPYSASKACSELITSAYRRSFLQSAGVAVASARAGNVIGGGDRGEDRLVPDFLRATEMRRPLLVRSPDATRPWQHVLEPLSGYLLLAERLLDAGSEFAEAWNFGPADETARSVRWVVEYLCSRFERATWQIDEGPKPTETRDLALDAGKARARLDWSPRWDLSAALDATIDWELARAQGADMAGFSLRQVEKYSAEPTRVAAQG